MPRIRMQRRIFSILYFKYGRTPERWLTRILNCNNVLHTFSKHNTYTVIQRPSSTLKGRVISVSLNLPVPVAEAELVPQPHSDCTKVFSKRQIFHYSQTLTVLPILTGTHKKPYTGFFSPVCSLESSIERQSNGIRSNHSWWLQRRTLRILRFTAFSR